jgi:2-methylcitrate dehydratase PrpD
MAKVDLAAADRRGFLAAATLGTGGALLTAPALAQGPVEAAGQIRAPAPKRPQASDPSGGVSGVISAHIANATFADLDAATIDAAKLRLLDLVGCAIGGVRGEGGAALASAIASDGQGRSSVLGTGRQASARDAAMANAVLARTFDFEVMTVVVGGQQVPSHHAPTTVMSALALAEQQHVDGRAFLTALSVGDDLSARTLAAAGIDFNDGWDGAPLHSTMGAAAIAARLMGLDATKTRHALGMAADQIGGTVQSIWDGASAWKIQQGTAARNGIFAAEAARAGWTGMADPLLGARGFYAQFTPGCTRPALLTQELGKTWHGEIYFKPWPSCAANHPAIECALALREKTSPAPADIEAVRILVNPHVLDLFIAKPLQSGPSAHSQANFNIQFAVATALLHGGLRQEHYLAAALVDPALTSLIGRTSLAALPAGARGVIVEVRRKDGHTVAEALPGKPRHYPDVAGSTRAEVEAKFRHQVAFAGNVQPERADALVRRIAAVEKERDMADFAQMLADTVRFPEI